MKLLAELKRRNVIRMAGLYLIVAWLALQVAETVLPIFRTPGWVLQSLVVLLAVGFVPVLVFAWIFELTPEGLKRDGEVTSGESIAPQTARRMNWMIVVGLALVIVLLLAERLLPRAAPVEAVAPPAVDLASTDSSPQAAPTSPSAMPDKSIEVSRAPPIRAELSIAPAERLWFHVFPMHAFALSPDGSRLVFAGQEGARRMLYLRVLATRETTALPGTDNAANPVFSPDGEWILFFGGGFEMRKVPVSGGSVAVVAHAPNYLGGAI